MMKNCPSFLAENWIFQIVAIQWTLDLWLRGSFQVFGPVPFLVLKKRRLGDGSQKDLSLPGIPEQ